MRLGLPILVAQLGMIVVGFADTIMVGRYSTEALASASFVNNVFNTALLCCIGFTYGILPLVGALFAQGSKRRIGALMLNAVTVNIAFSLIVTAVMAVMYLNLEHLGQPAELLPLIRPYYLLYLGGLLPVAIYNVFVQWSYGINNTVMPMWIILIANVVNVVGNYMLIYGAWGMPEMGLTGAGISTLVARLICPVAIMAWFFLTKRNREYGEGFRSGGLSHESLRLVAKTSFPVSMQMSFETAAFSVSAIMAGWIGAVPLAAFQIIVIVGQLGFMLYYAIGAATAVLVSNEAGHSSCSGMRRAGWSGYHVMLLLALFSTVIFVLFARPLMHLFTEDDAVLGTALTLIVPLVAYQLGDATQVTFANALRGTSHVMPMLWIAFVSYIVVGIPSTYLMAFTFGMGIYGIVLSFSVSLFLAGALFLTFFLRSTRHKNIIYNE